MKIVLLVVAGTLALCLNLAAQSSPAPRGKASPTPPTTQTPAPPTRSGSAPPLVKSHASTAPVSDAITADAQTALVKQYCTGCHSDRGKAGGLSLVSFDATLAADNAAVAEKMIRKLRAGMMPPAGAKRPEGHALLDLAVALENRIDRAAALNPNPGWRPFQRLNRAEYAHSVRDLLDIDLDVSTFLPPDTVSHGFDNVADSQAFSPTLLEGYLRAAARISTLAVGDRTAGAAEATYKVPRTMSQLHHIDGAPMGTRGGIVVNHVFPADGEYVFRVMLHSIPTGQLYGSIVRGEQIEFSIDGERAALLDVNPRMSESDPNGMNLKTPPMFVPAGPHRVAAAFIERFNAPVDDLIAPIEYTLADSQIGSAFGVTTLPHVRDFAITGPLKVTGVSDTPSRRRIFTCRPLSAAEEAPCATKIVSRLAAQAYRRPTDAEDIAGLMKFYDQGRKEGGNFEAGVRMALQAILASPQFIFRLEQAPGTAKPGQNYRITDYDLATRLSYFLWASVPDQELLTTASRGTLGNPVVFEKQVRRMLADKRSEALATRFASQWFRLQDIDQIKPDALAFPAYDQILAESMRRETELVFNAIIHEDRPVTELLTADFTFVNERLAEHYRIPNVAGSDFQRVPLTDPNRRGILGHGSILMLTSVADRTSPVLRGKWIMEVLLGSPPPPPPPNVPAFEESSATEGGRLLTVRERMEQHRKNPACNSCHRVIDPLGLALENFDVTGQWRIRDNGNPVDPTGDLYEGTRMEGPVGLRQALLKHSDLLLLSFTENLMTYALGRRVEFYDMPAIRAIIRDAAKNDSRISSFILGVAKSPAFQMSRAEKAETTNDR